MSRPTTRWCCTHWIRSARVASSRRTDEVTDSATGRIGHSSAIGDAAVAIGGPYRKRETVSRGVTYKACRVGHDRTERQLAIQQVGEYNGTASGTVRDVHRQCILHQLPWRHNLPAWRVGALTDRHYRVNRVSSPTTRWRCTQRIRTTRVTSPGCTNEVAHCATGCIGDQGAVGNAATAVGRTHRKRKAVGSRVTYKACRVGHDSAECQLAIQQVREYNGTASWTIRDVHRQRVLHQLPWRHNLPARWIRALANRYDWIDRIRCPATRRRGAHWIRTTRITSSRRTDEVADRPTRRIGHSSAIGDAATTVGSASSKRKAVGSRVTYEARRVSHDSAERQLAVQQVGEYNGAASWTVRDVHRQRVLHQLPWRHGLTAWWVGALANRYDWINRMSSSTTCWRSAGRIRATRVTSTRRANEVADRATRGVGHNSAVGNAAAAIGGASSKRETVGSRVTYKARRVGHDSAECQLAIQQVSEYNRTASWTVRDVHRQRVLHQLPWRHNLPARWIRALADRYDGVERVGKRTRQVIACHWRDGEAAAGSIGSLPSSTRVGTGPSRGVVRQYRCVRSSL